MGKRVDSKKFLHNCAGTMMGQLRLDGTPYHQHIYSCASNIRDYLPQEWKDRISKHISAQSDEYVGRLACTDPFERSKVVTIATELILGALAQRIWDDRKKIEVRTTTEPHLKCKFCGWKIARKPREPNEVEKEIGMDPAFEALWEHIGEEHPDEALKIAGFSYGDEDEE